jgi:signal transduction histidine kinase
LLGLSDVQENSKALVDILHEVDLLTMLRGCIADYKPSSKEVELALDGSLRAYAATAQPILSTHEGAILGAVLTLRDVTEERENEKAKSDFLSMVSHELRTPLNSIYGFLAIILSGKAGPLSDLQADFLSTAKQEASVLKRLINDLIDYSRLEKRLLRMEMAPVDFSSLATRVIRSATARMEQDELTLASQIPNGMMVLGDEVRLQQVFDNLLENAAKFTDPGGEVSFRCDAEEGRIKIRVIDSGCGIPQSQIDSIFERFFQADNHSSRRRQGQGLGLAICKHIVEAHDGLIWAESTPGVGTTMYVELPVLSKDGAMAAQFSGDLTFSSQKQQ